MARNKEVISAGAPIPVGIPLGNNPEVVSHDILKTLARVIGVRSVNVSNDGDDADWDEEGVGLVRAASQEMGFRVTASVQLRYHLSFNGVDVIQGTMVEQRWLSFFVCPYFEPLLHLDMAPVRFHAKESCLN